MNIGTRWTVLTLAVAMSGILTGCAGAPPTVSGPVKAGAAAKTRVLTDTQDIAVDILTVSYALTSVTEDKSPASRAVKLNIAKVHTASARATAAALSDKALIAVGSTAKVRDNITATLKALGTEVDVTIACEKEKKPSCSNEATLARQGQAGQAAGAAVVQLMRAAKVEQKFVAAAANVVQQNLTVPGTASLDTVAVRKQATVLAPNIVLPPAAKAGPPTTAAPTTSPKPSLKASTTVAK